MSCDDLDRNDFTYFDNSNFNSQFNIQGFYESEYESPSGEKLRSIMYLYQNGLFFNLDLGIDNWKSNRGGCMIIEDQYFNGILSWGTFQVITNDIISVQKKETKTNRIGTSGLIILNENVLVYEDIFNKRKWQNFTIEEMIIDHPRSVFRFVPCSDKPDSSRSHIYKHFKGD